MATTNTHREWLVRPKPRPQASTILLCLPYAGSGAAAYRGWAESAGDLDLCYIQLPGRENRLRETPHTSMPGVVSALVQALEGFLDRPYALYGHSLGGVVAYELAQALCARGGAGPLHLFVSASRAPHLPPEHEAISHLPEEELFQEVHRRYNAVPLEIMNDPELRQLLAPGLRADLSILETYRHSAVAPLPCGITCFGAEWDRMVSRRALEEWRVHTMGGFHLQMFDEGHLFLQTRRSELLSAVSETLRRTIAMQSAALAPQYGRVDARASQ